MNKLKHEKMIISSEETCSPFCLACRKEVQDTETKWKEHLRETAKNNMKLLKKYLKEYKVT